MSRRRAVEVRGIEVEGRSVSPEEAAIQKEECPDGTLSERTPEELRVVGRTWRELRRFKPHLYVVLKAWTDLLPLREEPTRYSSRVYRGFYAELSRKLGITENAVKYRLQSGIRWFAGRVRFHAGRGTLP
jgi:hypothetical protein